MSILRLVLDDGRFSAPLRVQGSDNLSEESAIEHSTLPRDSQACNIRDPRTAGIPMRTHRHPASAHESHPPSSRAGYIETTYERIPVSEDSVRADSSSA